MLGVIPKKLTLIGVVLLGLVLLIAIMPNRPEEAQSPLDVVAYDLDRIQTAICVHYFDHSEHVSQLHELEGRYLARIPPDPWQNDYQFEYPNLWSTGGNEHSKIGVTIECLK